MDLGLDIFEFKPHLENIPSAEPHLLEIIYNYYLRHFDSEASIKYTAEYLRQALDHLNGVAGA
jgi:hypothetical protein